MKITCILLALFSILLWSACLAREAKKAPVERAHEVYSTYSPDSTLCVSFFLKGGVPHYQISRQDKEVMRPSRLGFVLKNAPPLDREFRVRNSSRSGFDETWTQPWGEVKDIRNHYNELRIELEEIARRSGPPPGPGAGSPQPGAPEAASENQNSSPGAASTPLSPAPRRLTVVFRVFDDGVGFRYEIPEQAGLVSFDIMDELTEFALPAPHDAWWIPAYKDNRYEYLYTKSPVDQLDVVHTPLTMETRDGLFLSIHEANLVDYASMTLRNAGNNVLKCDLVPWSDGVRVKARTPVVTPWRTVQVAETAGDLVTSYLVLNLNEPNKLADVSWVKPAKYVGIWWGMHLGMYTWHSGKNHGATTENVKRYIDFAARHEFPYVLVEGWNVGWDGKWWEGDAVFDFTKPYPDFDIDHLSRYAASKGVKLVGHHETSAAVDYYESVMDQAFSFCKRHGIDAVKTGYVGTRANKTEWHHGQYMVRHYRKVIERAAQYGIMLDVHEPIKDTGERRTFPNMMTREGARGMEYDAWSPDGGNPPEHTTVIPFTRMLAGPFDFTPGILDLFYPEYKPNNRVNTTLAKQLAYYVVIYSPFQMAADLPENYENQPAFRFIKDVPVDWEETRVLHARIGDYVTIARKDRNSDDWYVGSITDENGRTLETKLDFLAPGREYVAEIYADADDADWEANPLALDIRSARVDCNTMLTIKLAPGGGQAVRISPAL